MSLNSDVSAQSGSSSVGNNTLKYILFFTDEDQDWVETSELSEVDIS